MTNNVFANGRELACKAGSGDVKAAFPDVCFMPPDKTPATPLGVPAPLALFSKDKDTNQGSKKVVISKKEVMLRDSSSFKKCSGNEAARTQKKGIINNKLTGKVLFTSWSMNVKIEGENVVRHLDMTTSNHSSPTSNQVCPWPRLSKSSSNKKRKKKPCSECNIPGVKPTQDEYDALASRMRSGARYTKKAKNLKEEGKMCYACETSPGTSPDHIIPIKFISELPGFQCMSTADQKRIVNHKNNFVGLCESCNKSKQHKLWQDWKGHSQKGLAKTKSKRKKEIEGYSDKVKKFIENEVSSAECT